MSASQRLAGELIKQGYAAKIEKDLDDALGRHSLLVDACPTRAIIMMRHITENMRIAAPGIPLGVQAAGVAQLSNRLLHDPLQIGVATMLFDVL